MKAPAAILVALALTYAVVSEPGQVGACASVLVEWRFDNLRRIGGHAVTVVGDPAVIATDRGPAVSFDGVDDGLVIDANPLAGLARFTIDIVFRPASGGAEEQRFLHFEEATTGNRALIELRALPGRQWTLDTFLRSPAPGLTLIAREKTHAADAWYRASLIYDGRTMTHTVDGVRELSGETPFAPLGTGQTAIGMRLNRVSWFKGAIHSMRVAADALHVDGQKHQSVREEWARGIEGQRKADLGNGNFLNPILAGDHPDPSILRDGDDYYMTFSSFDAYPGLVIWRSRDLVNWQPLVSTLRTNIGSVWAPDLVKHDGRYFIYFPARTSTYRSNYVIWADAIRGPWSDPIDLKIGQIDPGHAVGPDGTRWLFMSAGYLQRLAPDGLSVVGEMKKVYDGWQYPSDWIVEGFAQEGPKILRRGDYYYMVLAQGGTAGPPTGHMIVAARSRTIEGPWENSPHNPIIRTTSAAERWWSKGHGTLVEDRAGRWWIVYHAYENGFYTLGRQTLLEPIEWLPDGWFRTAGGDVSRPIPKPSGLPSPHGFAFSDDFSVDRMGVQWSFYNGDASDRQRYRYENNALVLEAKGTGPADSSPLWFVTGDHAYEVEVEIDADPGATAGLLLFYSRRLYAGLGFSSRNFFMHSYGLDRPQAKPAHLGQRLFLRLRNDRHIVTIHYSVDDQHWERYDRGMEVSGYHHNVAYDFLSLRPAIYAAGEGEVRFRRFRYRALP